jgi:catechol 2,3-dioxygenase-like lactoylglutathione lyase family enzyme
MIRPNAVNPEFELGGINHIALVCSDVARTVDFYSGGPRASSTGNDSAEPAEASVLAKAKPTPASSRTISSALGGTVARSPVHGSQLSSEKFLT